MARRVGSEGRVEAHRILTYGRLLRPQVDFRRESAHDPRSFHVIRSAVAAAHEAVPPRMNITAVGTAARPRLSLREMRHAGVRQQAVVSRLGRAGTCSRGATWWLRRCAPCDNAPSRKTGPTRRRHWPLARAYVHGRRAALAARRSCGRLVCGTRSCGVCAAVSRRGLVHGQFEREVSHMVFFPSGPNGAFLTPRMEEVGWIALFCFCFTFVTGVCAEPLFLSIEMDACTRPWGVLQDEKV